MSKLNLPDILTYKVDQALNLMLGQNGSTYINDTESHTGYYVGLHVIEDCIFATLTDENRDGNTLEGETFYRGMVITGYITVIKLDSGAVIAYKGKEYLGENG